MKRFAPLLFSSFLLFGCTGSSQSSKEHFDLVMYADEPYVSIMKELAQEAISNKEYSFEYNFIIRALGEGGSLDGGCLYISPSWNIPYMNLKYGVEEISSIALEGIDSKAISHFKFDNKILGLPISSRVSNYLIYDKTVLGENDIDTYESLYQKKGELELNFDNPFLDPCVFLSSLATFGYSLKVNQSLDGENIKAVVEHNFNSSSVLEKLKDYSRLFALDSHPTYSGKGYMAYPYGLWYMDYVKMSFGDNLAIANLPKYSEIELSPALEDLGLIVYNMASKKNAMPLVEDIVKALSSEKAQKRYVSSIGLSFTPTNLKAREDYPLDEALYTAGLEKAVPSRGYPGQVLSLTSTLVSSILKDNGKCEEGVLQKALNDYCDALDKLVITD